MTDRIPKIIKHQFFVHEMQLKQLRHEQLSKYLRLWVLSMEAIFLGLGLLLVVVSGMTLITDGVSEAASMANAVAQTGMILAMIMTVFLRIVWTAASSTHSTSDSPENVDTIESNSNTESCTDTKQ